MLDLIGLYKLIPQADFFPFIFQIFVKQVDDAAVAKGDVADAFGDGLNFNAVRNLYARVLIFILALLKEGIVNVQI